MNVSKLNRTVLNKNVLNKTNINISLTDFRLSKKQGMENEIMKSLALWYDLEKQGATNESMAADPRIIDHSGNGHHAECYNFAWAGMSGIGGYVANYLTFAEFLTNGDRGTGSVSGEKITITSASTTNNLIESDGVAAHKIKVTGLTGTGITLRYGAGNAGLTLMTEDGEYELPDHQGDTLIGYSLAEAVESCDITIEQLPLYPNALVSDGVDDYAKVTGLPIFTKDKGFTCIFKMDNNVIEKGFMIDMSNPSSYLTTFAVQILNGKVNPNSYGKNSALDISYFQDVNVFTKNNFNGADIAVGDYEPSQFLFLFKYHNNGQYKKTVFYQMLLFDRTLTAEEIEWVKTNMIGGDEL